MSEYDSALSSLEAVLIVFQFHSLVALILNVQLDSVVQRVS